MSKGNNNGSNKHVKTLFSINGTNTCFDLIASIKFEHQGDAISNISGSGMWHSSDSQRGNIMFGPTNDMLEPNASPQPTQNVKTNDTADIKGTKEQLFF